MDFSSDEDDNDNDNELRLPKVPRGWDPNSVSEIEKRHDISEKLLGGQYGTNESQAQELYFSPVEMEGRIRVREQQITELLKEEARKEIEAYCGMEWKYIKKPQRREAMQALEINPFTEVMENSKILAALGGSSAAPTNTSQISTNRQTSASETRPSDSPRSKSSLKRQNSGSRLRGRPVKKTRIITTEPTVSRNSRRSASQDDGYSVDIGEEESDRWGTI